MASKSFQEEKKRFISQKTDFDIDKSPHFHDMRPLDFFFVQSEELSISGQCFNDETVAISRTSKYTENTGKWPRTWDLVRAPSIYPLIVECLLAKIL